MVERQIATRRPRAKLSLLPSLILLGPINGDFDLHAEKQPYIAKGPFINYVTHKGGGSQLCYEASQRGEGVVRKVSHIHIHFIFNRTKAYIDRVRLNKL